MKKIAYLINYISKTGPGNVVLNLISNLDREKYTPLLITLFQGNDPKVVAMLENEDIEVIQCEHESRLKGLLFGRAELEYILREKSVDILHTHGFIPDGLSAQLYFPEKRLCTLHCVLIEYYTYEYGKIKGFLYTKIHGFWLKKLDQVVCCSESVYEAMGELRNSTYIRNGIEAERCTSTVSRSKLGIAEDAMVYIYTGSLSELKRVKDLVRFFHTYRNQNEVLLILGQGPQMEACKAVEDKNILILGYQNKPIDYMAISDVYISASSLEGFSISILEALSVGLFLFLSDIPAHKEVLSLSSEKFLGSTFRFDMFDRQLEQLRNELNLKKREERKNFYHTFLSAQAMTDAYQKLYG